MSTSYRNSPTIPPQSRDSRTVGNETGLQQTVRDYPLPSTVASLGAGLAVGLAVGLLIGGRDDYRRWSRSSDDRLGRRLADALASVMPDKLTS